MPEYTVLHLFSGLGGCALGFRQARSLYRGLHGRFRTLGGIDVDTDVCADFETLTGVPATRLDIATMTPEDLTTAAGGESPDVIFASPPCKGFSGLLASSRLAEPKYQRLNALVFQGLWLALETWRATPPKLIVLENVPRIQSRGAELLQQLRELLWSYGYRIHEGLHDCGEVGGLAQRRRRFLLVARHEQQVPTFVYRPPLQRVRGVGEVLGQLPLPDDPAAGPLHRLPRLQWKTWLRLALIPAGGDWRALGTRDGGEWRGTYGIIPWNTPLGTVTGNGRPAGGAFAVADPRFPHRLYNNVFRIVRWDEPSVTVTGAWGPISGGVCIADPRIAGKGSRNDLFGVLRWDQPAKTISGHASVSGSNCPAAVADPRFTCSASSHRNKYKVLRWDDAAGTVIGATRPGSGAPSVADPRIPTDTDRPDPPPLIIAEDGTWHRPLTTLELAALQGLPVLLGGRPLQLAGNAHGRWRERIGNAVPPPAAKAVGESLLEALLSAEAGETFRLGSSDVWVRHNETQQP